MLFFKFLGDSDTQPGWEPLLFLVPLMDFFWRLWVFLSPGRSVLEKVFLFIKSWYLVGFRPHSLELPFSRSLSLLFLTQQLYTWWHTLLPWNTFNSWFLPHEAVLPLRFVLLSSFVGSTSRASLLSVPLLELLLGSLLSLVYPLLSVILFRPMAFRTIHTLCSLCSTVTAHVLRAFTVPHLTTFFFFFFFF